jgi:16S rRNA (cytosine1402-N4)-methyltransferase
VNLPAAHIPVLLTEAVAALAIRANGVYVDATFGRGGHSRAILAALGPEGRLIALDRDLQAIAEGQVLAHSDPRFQIVHAPFSRLAETLQAMGMTQVDGILLDIGVSSPQIDQTERGFSFRGDAPLDMRMDTTTGMSAAQWLALASETEIAEVVRDYGEERFARRVAKAIVEARQQEPLLRTRQLAEICQRAVRTREPGQDPATRTFQAVRIYINRELEELAEVLPQALAALGPGGRLAVISFHSLEDRQVKQFMRTEAQGPQIPAEVPMPAHLLPQGRLTLVGKAMRASAEELRRNPRARSAVLRVAERRGLS